MTNGGFEATANTATPGFGWSLRRLSSEGSDYFVDTMLPTLEADPIRLQTVLSERLASFVGEHRHPYRNQLRHPSCDPRTQAVQLDGTAIQVSWDGNVVYSATDIPGFSYSEIVIDPIATSTSTTLAIGLRDDSFFLNVDTISVRQVQAQAPEPVTLALVGLGLAGLSLSRRKQSLILRSSAH